LIDRVRDARGDIERAAEHEEDRIEVEECLVGGVTRRRQLQLSVQTVTSPERAADANDRGLRGEK
jgi:hypothetical protein